MMAECEGLMRVIRGLGRHNNVTTHVNLVASIEL